MNLYMGKKNTIYEVVKVLAPSNIKNILYSLGVIPGVKIKKVFKSLFNDPVAYEIKGTIVAIRNEYVKYIEVTEVDE